MSIVAQCNLILAETRPKIGRRWESLLHLTRNMYNEPFLESKYLLICTMLGPILLGIAGCGQTNQAAVTPVATLTTDSPTSTAIPTPMYLTPLPTPILPPTLAYQIQVREATRIAVLTSVPQATLGPDWTPPPQAFSTSLPLPPGVLHPAGAGTILEDGQSSSLLAFGHFQNQWFEQRDTQTIRVYAGADAHDDQQGLLVVTIHSPGQQPQEQVFLTPQRAGWIRVVDAVGERLTLQAQNTSLLYFDLPIHQWIPITPTALPAPSSQPVTSARRAYPTPGRRAQNLLCAHQAGRSVHPRIPDGGEGAYVTSRDGTGRAV